MLKLMSIQSNKHYLLGTLLLIFLCGAEVLPQGGKQLSLDDLMAVRHAESMSVSPDGSEIIFTLVETDPGGVTSRTLSLVKVSSRDPKPFLATKRNAYAQKWSPDGGRVAFISNDEKNIPQIWIAERTGANPSQLTEAAPVLSFEWSPTGNAIAYVSRVAVPRGVVTVEGAAPHTDLLFGLDLETKKAAQLSPEAGSGLAMSWSPAGDRIAYSSQKLPGFYGGFESDIYIFDVKTGRASKVVDRPGMDKNPQWSPDGKYLAFLSTYGRPGGLLPNIGLSILSVADNRVIDLGARLDKGGFFEGPSKVAWSSDSKNVFYAVNYGSTTKIIRADIAQQTVSVFSDGHMSYDEVNTARSKNVMAFRASDSSNPVEIYLTPLERFDPTRITDLNPQIKKIDLPSAEVVKWASADGSVIEGILVKPANFDRNKKYPLLVYLHGGPASSNYVAFPSMQFYNPLQGELLTAHDYVVLSPNFRGSGGYGYDFRASLKNDWGALPYQDVMGGVEHLIQTGFIDSQRLGIMGWSYGGYLAAYAITRTDRFKAAVVGAGVTDLFGHFGKLPEQMLEYYAGRPWEPSTKSNYERSSPMSHVHKIKTPTLIIHGENDNAVSINQAEQLHAALKTLGVENQFVKYSGQGHSFSDRNAQRESFERVLAWFNSKLKTRR